MELQSVDESNRNDATEQAMAVKSKSIGDSPCAPPTDFLKAVEIETTTPASAASPSIKTASINSAGDDQKQSIGNLTAPSGSVLKATCSQPPSLMSSTSTLCDRPPLYKPHQPPTVRIYRHHQQQQQQQPLSRPMTSIGNMSPIKSPSVEVKRTNSLSFITCKFASLRRKFSIKQSSPARTEPSPEKPPLAPVKRENTVRRMFTKVKSGAGVNSAGAVRAQKYSAMIDSYRSTDGPDELAAWQTRQKFTH